MPSAHRPGTILPSREPALSSGLSAFCMNHFLNNLLSEEEAPMWFFPFLLFLQSSPAPCPPIPPTPPGPATIIVQTVDPDYIPIIGATVTVKPLTGKTQSISVRTGDDGYAKFYALPDSDCSIEVKMANFKSARLKELHLSRHPSQLHTAYVQFVMKISSRDAVTVD